MKDQEFSSSLMEKLAGNLSENEARQFEQDVASDDSLQEEYSFYAKAWEDLGDLNENPTVPNSLSANFYSQLAAIQEQKEKTVWARVLRLKEELLTASPLARNLSFGLFLLAFGFILGGKFTTKKIEVNHNVQQVPTANSQLSYALSTDKIQQINTIAASETVSDETIDRLQSIIQTEEDTNVRLAALSQLSKYSSEVSLKSFYLQQLEKEQSPLIQVELLNSIIENSRTKESINTMESMLAKRSLNPVVQEKIRKDLPVLRASYVE